MDNSEFRSRVRYVVRWIVILYLADFFVTLVYNALIVANVKSVLTDALQVFLLALPK